MNEQQKEAFQAYLKPTYDEKVAYWSGQLHPDMRWNGESGVDEYDVFSKEWLTSTRELEPQIDRILEDVFETKWKGYWDVEEIRRRLEN